MDSVNPNNDRCQTLPGSQTLQSLRHEPYILPSNNAVIPSMTAKRFNEMKEEEDAEYGMKLQELINRLRNKGNTDE